MTRADASGISGCLPGLRLLALRAGLPAGGRRPGRPSDDGGIEEFPLFREISRSTLRSSSSIIRPCSAITLSRAVQPARPAAGSGAEVTGHHDQDIRAVIKPTRWAGLCKDRPGIGQLRCVSERGQSARQLHAYGESWRPLPD